MTIYINTLSAEHVKNALHAGMKFNDYAGYDPFDALNSRLFSTLQLDRVPFFRLAWLQLHKRLPINLRPLVGVPKKRNPKGIALTISGLLEDYQRTGQNQWLEEAIKLADWLLDNRCDPQQWPHHCWGYHFPWQARAFYVPKGKPNIITTCYAVSALLKLAELTGNNDYLHAAIDAGQFLGTLYTEHQKQPYFVYIPGETAFVHNASLWGAAIASQIASLSGDSKLMDKACKAVEQSVSAQNTDGSWVYGNRSHHQFIDSFHTGYNLEAIWHYQQHSKDQRFDSTINKGLAYYRSQFFLEDGTPKYYNNSIYPIDMHSVAQAIFTLGKVGGTLKDKALIKKVINWSIGSMFMPEKKAFRYQKHPRFNNNVCYIRWTQAWMYYALSYWCRLIK